MGCVVSTTTICEGGKRRRWPRNIGEVAVFVPGMRIPKGVAFLFQSSFNGNNKLPKTQVENLSNMRAKIVAMASQVTPHAMKPRRRKATQQDIYLGGSVFSDLLQALENYLSVLLGLITEGSELVDKVEFVWVNQEDGSEETKIANGWYEVLSVLHLMAMLCLSEANLLLLSRPSTKYGFHVKIIEVKAAGYLDCALKHVLPKISPQVRRDLPIDLTEEVLAALCAQALGQGVDLQLWMAIDSPKATLAVKRRLACEMVKYYQQAYDNIMKFSLNDGWGAKHQLFAKWKYFEAKAVAYYYHGMVLYGGKTEKSREMAIASLQATEQFSMKSKKANEAFNKMPPISRNPSPWGSMKYLSEKISKEISVEIHINEDHSDEERFIQNEPLLPDFNPALKPEEYHLPSLDPLWTKEDKYQYKT
ncbi:hypothetical protein J5N97_029075 [Dioscorea zingiberensis]|uniref:BRO1 domain-containing protein n=1 Tax=Dioscorea zingiberensis TaxID=325984 RepID=A0A9D5C0K6_9LILI|nr:hypothetical protein J5N97_029075 [Dioscorea zingiberensis]